MLQTVLDLEDASVVLKILGDKTRLTILKMLQNNACCVCEFTAVFQTSQPAISQHLRKLRDLGLVKESRKGQWIFYSLNKDSEYFFMVEEVLAFLPNQDYRIKDLEAQGLRISCD